VILASTSRYRRELLGRLLSDFRCRAPEVDETPIPGEAPAERARRLALLKAEACAEPGQVVIGSDQVASLDGRILRKPGGFEAALAQLQACSGRSVQFHTAVSVIGPGGGDSHLDLTQVNFRSLDTARLAAYLRREQPYDCAGSFKSEGLGVMLMDSIETRDPTALQGLPLIWLAGCLQRMGIGLV